jgi:UrcA family protein
MFRHLSMFGVAAVCLAASPPLLAQEDTMTVRVGDLDLNSAGGARTALARARASAEAFCGGEPDLRQLARAQMAKDCRATMVARAVRAMNAPRVTALFQGRTAGATFARR